MKAAVTVCVGALIATAAVAETREMGAHEHGHGALNIAFEGDAVLMELRVPGADIVGFEHAAESAEDRAAIDAAVAMLAKPLDLFIPEAAAGCVVTSASVELESEGDEHEEHGHDDHKDDDHAHDDDHKDDDHEEHADEKHEHEEHAHDDHDGEEGAGHTEFHAEYALTCNNPSAIRGFDFAYFAQFPNAQELEIQLISDKGAKGFEVERDEPRLDLSGAI